MQFVDQADITVIAGAGGNGCSAMHKQPFTRYPRPAGGSGGDGGDVVLQADAQLATLLDVQFRHEFKAERGQHGRGNTRKGRRGTDCLIRIPVGTLITDARTSQLLKDLVVPDERMVVAKGGPGGIGNAYAERATPGAPGETRQLRLELKLLADVGLVGFPNAGKSSLLARISMARPKTAPYPFTTRVPVLGVVRVDHDGEFVACDIPGLIEGAHEGRGLGMQFLRHIERTKLLLHVVDLAAVDGRDPVQAFAQLNEELAAYHPSLRQRPQLVVANKMDLVEARTHLERFQAAVGDRLWPISCATGSGIPELIRATWQRLQPLRAASAVTESEAR